MIPVRLSCIGTDGGNAEFVFNSLKDLYPLKAAEQIKQYVGYALFGNDALYKGKIRFEFGYLADSYVVERDFENNCVSLTINGVSVPEAGIDETLAKVFRLTQGQWTEFAVASKHSAYDGITKNISAYGENVLAEAGITPAVAGASAVEYRKQIYAIDNKKDVLETLLPADSADKEKLSALKEEILSIKSDAARLDELIGAGKLGKTTAEKIAATEELLQREEAKSTRIDTDKKRLARSFAIKEHFSVIKEVGEAEKEAEAVKKELDGLNAKSAKLEAVIAAGNKVYHKKEEEFLAANARVAAVNQAFDELIKQNRESGRSDEYVTGMLADYCKEGDDKKNALRAELESVSEERESVVSAIKAQESELGTKRLSAEFRNAVREGACIEVALAEKRDALAATENSIKADEDAVNALKDEYARNEATLAVCREGYDKVFGSAPKNKRTLANLIRQINELERVKQSLYRNQILSATLLQDISAIDKKIGENTDLRRSCADSRGALEGAKKTLIVYSAKCEDAIKEKTDELNGILAEKKYYEGLDALEYGAKCPVCSAPVSDKADCEKALAELEVKENEARKEIDRLKSIALEYHDKLENVNKRLGAYESTDTSASGYIKSLEQTKTSNLAALKKIYDESGVRNHEELTAALERVIAEMSKFSAAITDVKALSAKEESAVAGNSAIGKRLSETVGKVIPEKRNVAARLHTEINEYEEEYKKLQPVLGDATAISLLENVVECEAREEELCASLDTLYAKKSELDAKIDALTKEIAVYEGHTYAFEKDGKEFDYATLCINIASEQYNEVVDEIRRTEAVKLKAQDELVAIGRVLKDKRAAADELNEQIEEKQKRYDVLTAYAETLKNSESYEAKLLEGTSYDTVKSEILEDKAAESLSEEIAAYEAAVTKYACELSALKEVLDETYPEYTGLDNNMVAARELNDILASREEEYRKTSEKIGFAETIGDKLTELERDKADVQKRLSDVTDVMEGRIGDLLIVKINNSLNAFMPEIRVKLKGEGLAVLSRDRNGAEKELDRIEDEAYVAVAVCAINAVRQILSETLNTDSLMRIVKVRANMLKDETRARLKEFGANNNLIIVFHK